MHTNDEKESELNMEQKNAAVQEMRTKRLKERNKKMVKYSCIAFLGLALDTLENYYLFFDEDISEEDYKNNTSQDKYIIAYALAIHLASKIKLEYKVQTILEEKYKEAEWLQCTSRHDKQIEKILSSGVVESQCCSIESFYKKFDIVQNALIIREIEDVLFDFWSCHKFHFD